MYVFTIEYYYEYYNTENLNTTDTRTAIVYADNRDEAIKKVKNADNDFVRSKSISFREISEI